tara:strand:- start:210 stop:440 length:231 start_codon:yes stop_codon:yes gene_type:complete
MNESFAKEVAIRSLLKSKGYEFDKANQYWFREWSTNGGDEKVLEIAVKTDDGEWNKLMMNQSGHIFYAKETGNSIN